MIKQIKKYLFLPENNKLVSNFFSLSVLQVAGLILPLLVFPYLILVLGVEKFGLIIYAQAIMSYFVVFTDYGFNLSATRDISININNKKKIADIFNTVFFTKIILLLFSFIILIFILFIFKSLQSELLLYFSSFFIVIGQSLFPIWFFQGVEKMKFITYLNIIAKIIFTGLIFLLIKEPSDYIYANLFLGLGTIISSIISVYVLYKNYNIKIILPSFKQIESEIKNGFHILLSSFSINIYLNTNIIILSFFVNPLIIAYYSIAEKIMLILRQLLSVFSQVIYPHICKLVQKSHSQLILFYKKIYIPFLIVIILLSILLYLLADMIVLLLTNTNNLDIVNLVKLIAFVPIIVCLNIPAYQTLLAYDMRKSYSFILSLGSLVSVILNFLLSYYFQAIGTCISIIITEALITLGLYLVLEFKNKNYSLFTLKNI